MSKIISLIITILLMFESVPLVWLPTLEVDVSKQGDEISTYASGYLYGLADNGVPSEAMTDSIDITSVSAKVIGGLQHPTGDVDNVAGQLDECEYIVVYLQDCFDTWYYCYDEIMALRKAGTYDWKEFIEERFLPTVEAKVKELKEKDYADRLVYCLYNECDNAIWFGNYVDGNLLYDETGRQNFYEAWKITYDLVKSIDPDATIGGPGFYDYETTKIEGFMDFCTENNCVPEIIIYHELAYWSVPDWYAHVEDYRRIEKENGLSEHTIIVTEYGEMEECGNPADMLHYIICMEETNIYGNVAFWRLSNNLNDTAADDNSPNSNWWLYRKYAEMEGNVLQTSSKSDSIYNPRERLDGIATLTSDKKTVNMIVTGQEEKFAVKIKNLDETDMDCRVDVKIECVYYKGLTGIVSEPILLRQYTATSSFGNLNINVPATDDDAVYFITVTEHDGDIEAVRNTNIPVRYEFESGTLIGTAYTYDSAYATTGDIKGMCGGFENDGDGVKLTFKVDAEGWYDLDVIFGKHNDAATPDGRDYAEVYFTLDGESQVITFENTIKSEYTSCKTLNAYLSKGTHTVEFSHKNGTFVLDSMLVAKTENDTEIAVLKDSANGSEFLAVAPYDGFYQISTSTSASVSVDGAKGSVSDGSLLYLRRGLNEILFDSKDVDFSLKTADTSSASVFSTTVKASDMTLSDGATLNTDKYGNTYVASITSESGKATFTVNASKAGDYRITLLYANNGEGGVHSYNVDLIERYVSVSVNGAESEDIYCRNTYSNYTYKTMTFNVTLAEGANTVTLTNSGNYIFNNTTAIAPLIKSVTVNSAVA